MSHLYTCSTKKFQDTIKQICAFIIVFQKKKFKKLYMNNFKVKIFRMGVKYKEYFKI